MAKTALEKLRDPKKIVQITKVDAGTPWAPEGATMVISTPAEIDGLMSQVPKGKITTSDALRAALTEKHNVAVACPLTTGIFVNIAMKASEELAEMGAPDCTAWWRTIKSDGSLNPKAPGGVDGHKARLEAEGVAVERKGRINWRVSDHEKLLFQPKG